MMLNRENKEHRQVVLTIQVERDPWEKALNEAYWIAKEKNKKYTPKKYRKGTSEQ